MKNKLLLTLLFLSTCFLGYSQYPTEEGYMLTTPGGSGNYIDLGSTHKRNFENHWEIQNEKLIGGTLQVIDISGKLLSERPVLDSKNRIQKPETPGVYIIKYYGNNKVINTKVIR